MNNMTRTVAILCHFLGINNLFYWLNRRAKRVITFHNVLRDELFRAGVANGVSVRLSDFEHIIDNVSKKFRFSLDLDDSATLTITFDDGYTNQYTTAFKALRKRGITAYLFCSGDCLENKTLTIDQLTHWIDCVPAGSYDLGRFGRVEVRDENRSEAWSYILWPNFLKDGASLGCDLFAACDAAYPMTKILASLPSDYVKERMVGVTQKQCDEMRHAGWKIGWHTQHHFPLSKLAADIALNEITPPAEMRNVCFSFPYGEDESVSSENVLQAEKIGYPSAVSNTIPLEINRLSYFRPRVVLSSDKYLMHFELSGCKHFFKCRKLLPVV